MPESPQWDRIRQRERLGHNEDIAFVADKLHGQLLAFSPLAIDLSVVVRNASIPVEPYLDSAQIGLVLLVAGVAVRGVAAISGLGRSE